MNGLGQAPVRGRPGWSDWELVGPSRPSFLGLSRPGGSLRPGGGGGRRLKIPDPAACRSPNLHPSGRGCADPKVRHRTRLGEPLGSSRTPTLSRGAGPGGAGTRVSSLRVWARVRRTEGTSSGPPPSLPDPPRPCDRTRPGVGGGRWALGRGSSQLAAGCRGEVGPRSPQEWYVEGRGEPR